MFRLRIAAIALLAVTPVVASDAPVATILSYHQVEPEGLPRYRMHPRPGAPDVPSEEARYTVSVADFDQQMDYLEKNGYHVIPLAELVDYVVGRRPDLPAKSIVITVDDGYLDAYTEIFPELQHRHMPFTLFIYPQIVGHGEEYVTWPQVLEMSRADVDIESHSFSHPFLTLRRNKSVTLDEYPKFLEHELLDSKNEIEKRIGKPVRFFAYPYSNVDEAVQQATKEYGYEAGLYDRDAGALIGRTTSPFNLIRFPILHDTSLDQFKAALP
jgi:peptidoglycan/xylan/chitin deacetylase (PgdA/CDA1 family)